MLVFPQIVLMCLIGVCLSQEFSREDFLYLNTTDDQVDYDDLMRMRSQDEAEKQNADNMLLGERQLM